MVEAAPEKERPVTTDNANLSADVFEAVVTAFAQALVSHYRERCSRLEHRATPAPPAPSAPPLNTEQSPWLRVSDAAKRAQCGRSTISRRFRRDICEPLERPAVEYSEYAPNGLTLGFKVVANTWNRRRATVGCVCRIGRNSADV